MHRLVERVILYELLLSVLLGCHAIVFPEFLIEQSSRVKACGIDYFLNGEFSKNA